MGIFPFDAKNVNYDRLVTGAEDFLTEAEVETEEDRSTPKKRSSIELVLQMEKDGTVLIRKQKVTPVHTPRKATPKKKATSNPEGATPGQLIDFDIINDPDFHVDGMDELIETFDFPDLGVAPLPDEPPPLGTTPVLLPQVGATEDVTMTVGVTEEVTTTVGATEDVTMTVGVTEEVTTTVGATEDVTMTVGATEDVTTTVSATGTTKEVSTDAGATKEVSTDAGVTKEVSTDAGVTKEGLTDAGATKAGSTDASATKEGSTNHPRFQFVKAAQEMLQQEAAKEKEVKEKEAKEKEVKEKEAKEKEVKERQRGPFQMPPWFPPPPRVAWRLYVPPPYFATMPPPMPPPGPWNMSPVQPMVPRPVSKEHDSEQQKAIERLEKRGAMPAIVLLEQKKWEQAKKVEEKKKTTAKKFYDQLPSCLSGNETLAIFKEQLKKET